MNLSGIRLGNGIARQYKNSKIRRGFFIGQSALSTIIVGAAVKEGSFAGVTLLTGTTALFFAIAKKCHNTVKSLEPAYQEIVQRANRIFKK